MVEERPAEPDTDAPTIRPPKWKGRVVQTVAIASVTVATLALLEGLSALAILVVDWGDDERTPIAEYHPLLGWTGRPSVNEPDYWAPGVGVVMNGQGLREERRVPRVPDQGRSRVLCVGDSFTFGEGVADEEAWCRLLGASPEAPETVNIGQPGYGVDQAYLRYRLLADSLEHSVVLFSFIVDDFRRMGPVRRNRAKPVLELSADSLVVGNIPVPTGGSVARTLASLAGELRVVEFGDRLVRRFRSGPQPLAPELRASREAIVRAMFEDLARVARRHDAVAVLVYLPTQEDFHGVRPWHAAARRLAEEAGTPLIDLSDELVTMSAGQRRELFIPTGAAANGHYSPAGNRWVATQLAERLAALLQTGFGSPGLVGGVALSDDNEQPSAGGGNNVP